MIQTQDIMKCLPLLASVLGDRYGVKVEIGGTEAYTDGKSIHIPAMSQEADATLLALVHAYIDHESAHVRDTDFTCLRNAQLTPFEKHIWNIIEDWRVEHKLSAVFPGCRQNFNWMIHHLFTDTSAPVTRAEEKSSALAVLNWLLLKVRSWDVAAVIPARDKEAQQVDAANHHLRANCAPVLKQIQLSCSSTQDGIDYAHKLVLFIEKKIVQSHDSCTTGNSSEQHNGEHTNTGNDEHDTAKQELRKLLQSDSDSLPKSVGESLALELQQTQQDVINEAITVAGDGQKDFFSLPQSELQRADRTSVASWTRLQALLQASTLQPCVSGKRGKLDRRKLYRVALHDLRVFVARGKKQSPDTAVHVLMDTSGSMIGNMQLTLTACYSLAKAIQTISGLSVGVSVFPAKSLTGTPQQWLRCSTTANAFTHGSRCVHPVKRLWRSACGASCRSCCR